MARPTTISENTRFTIGALIVVAGAIGWAAKVDWSTSSMAQDFQQFKIEKAEELRANAKLREDVAQMKAMLEFLVDEHKREKHGRR